MSVSTEMTLLEWQEAAHRAAMAAKHYEVKRDLLNAAWHAWGELNWAGIGDQDGQPLEQVLDLLADAILRILDHCGHMHWDLGEAMAKRLKEGGPW